LLEVDREGVQYDIIDTGAPVGRQVRLDTTTGELDFDPNLPFNAGETVFIIFKDV
jgi:hypothetical protein